MSTKKKEKQLLSGINGIAKPGEMVALMGARFPTDPQSDHMKKFVVALEKRLF